MNRRVLSHALHPGVELRATLKSISHRCHSKWHVYESRLKKPSICPWVASMAVYNLEWLAQMLNEAADNGLGSAGSSRAPVLTHPRVNLETNRTLRKSSPIGIRPVLGRIRLGSHC